MCGAWADNLSSRGFVCCAGVLFLSCPRRCWGLGGRKFALCARNAPNWDTLCVQGEFCTGSGTVRGVLGEFCTGTGGVGGLLLAVARENSSGVCKTRQIGTFWACRASFVPEVAVASRIVV